MPDQPVHIFIATPFPGVIWAGEIESHGSDFFDFFVLMKFSPVVSGDGLERPGIPANQAPGLFIEISGGPVDEFANHHKTGFPLDKGHDAVFGSLAHDRIDFPVSTVSAAFDAFGTLGNMTLSGHAAPAVIGSVAFSPPLG